jgi:trehalose 6-phosphate synthase complex regulatory subunit
MVSFYVLRFIGVYFFHLCSLGERYGLRIIPGKNSFLVLPNHVSRATAVGTILHPGGPARTPLARNGQRGGRSDSVNSLNGGWSLSSAGTSIPGDEYTSSFSLGGGGSSTEDVDFLLALSSDEKLLRRLNEFDGSETVSTSGKGTDGKWTLDSGEAVRVLEMLGDVV